MKTKLERTLLPIGFGLLAIGLIYLWVKLEGIGKVPPQAELDNVAYYNAAPDNIELSAASAAEAIPRTYVSYIVVRGAGGIWEVGGMWVDSKAWRYYYEPENADPTEFMRDVISALRKSGVLPQDVDLTKTNSNWVEILHPGGTPRRWWVLDSRDLPQKPIEQ